MDGLFSDEELFLTQNSFSEERVEDNFSIDSILDGLVACDTSNEAVSLSGSIGSQKAPLKREVEVEEETTRKFSKKLRWSQNSWNQSYDIQSVYLYNL